MKLKLNNIRWFINLVEESEICELEIWEGRRKIRIIKNGFEPHLVQRAVTLEEKKPAPIPEAKKELKTVPSSSVGTFHLFLEPGSEPLAKVGQEVKAGQTIAFVAFHEKTEKMASEKVATEWEGVIREILVKEGQSVEFGQPLFRIEVSS